MIKRERFKKIFHIAVPLMGAMISGNLMTIVDAAMVGRLGKVSVAAVGISGFSIGLVFASIAGLGMAVQIITSRRFGAGKLDELMLPVNGGLILALIIGCIIPAIAYPLAPIILELSNKDPAVVAEGLPYFQLLIFAVLPVGINGTLAGSWTGRGQTSKFTGVTIATHFFNIGLNYVLIFGKLGAPAMGIKGAALSSLISTFLSATTLFYMMYHERMPGFLSQKPSLALLRRMVSLMLPSSIRQMLQSAGFLVFIIMMGMLGTTAVAGTFILVRVMQVTLMPLGSIGAAGGTLAGQAMGAGRPEDAESWGYDSVKISATLLVIMGIPLMLFPKLILTLFINDPETVELAALPLRVLGANRIFFIGLTFAALLSAVGDPKRVMYVNVGLQWFLFLPLTFLLLKFGFGFVEVWVIRSIVAVLTPLSMGYLWYRGSWKKIQI